MMVFQSYISTDNLNIDVFMQTRCNAHTELFHFLLQQTYKSGHLGSKAATPKPPSFKAFLLYNGNESNTQRCGNHSDYGSKKTNFFSVVLNFPQFFKSVKVKLMLTNAKKLLKLCLSKVKTLNPKILKPKSLNPCSSFLHAVIY